MSAANTSKENMPEWPTRSTDDIHKEIESIPQKWHTVNEKIFWTKRLADLNREYDDVTTQQRRHLEYVSKAYIESPTHAKNALVVLGPNGVVIWQASDRSWKSKRRAF